jgi:hypothetical protein
MRGGDVFGGEDGRRGGDKTERQHRPSSVLAGLLG